jgi:hypothetical protein
MHYKQNIHNKNQTSTMKLFLPSHTTALNTARAIDGFIPRKERSMRIITYIT